MPDQAWTRLLEVLAEQLGQVHTAAEAATSVTEYAVGTLAVEAAAISVVHPPDRVTRLASSGSRLVEALGEGRLRLDPGSGVLRPGETITIDDTLTDRTWPGWSGVAATHGIRSVQLIGLLPFRGGSATLHLLSERPDVFVGARRARAEELARHAGLALRLVDRVGHLETAMQSRDLIGQAQGIVMERYDLSASRAMAFLRRASQDSHLKLREVARSVVAQSKPPG